MSEQRFKAPPMTILGAFSYDPVAGVFTRVLRNPKVRADFLAPNGYRRVFFAYKAYAAHRLAWLFVYGEWPDGFVDHIDGDPGNNAIENLRKATNAQNQMNVRRKGNLLKGVTFHKQTGKYRAQIKVGGVSRYLGLFETESAAHLSYLAAAKECFGEFARAG